MKIDKDTLADWLFRVVFALAAAPGIGGVASYFAYHSASHMEGANGYAAAYIWLLFTPFAFLALLSVRKPITRIIVTAISVPGWLFAGEDIADLFGEIWHML